MLLFAGIIYAWSLLRFPFEAIWDSEALLGLNYTLTITFFCIGGLCSGLISKKTKPMHRLILSAVLLFAGFFIASRLVGAEGTSIVWLYLSYGVLCGTGIGFVYNTVISATNAWYPDKTGFSAGILLAGFGLSLITLGSLAEMLGKSEAIGWRNTFLIIAITMGVILLVAAFVVKPPPPDTVFPEKKESKRSKKKKKVRDYSTLDMIKRPAFYKIFFIMLVLSATGSAAIGCAKRIALDVGAIEGEGFLTVAVGLLGVSNAFGRFAIGWFYDNIGTRNTQYVVSVTAVAAPLAIVAALLSGSLALGVLGLCMCGFAFGLAPTTGSVFVSKFYGPRNFALNFSVVNLVLVPAPFATTMAGWLRDTTDSFLIAFIILAALSLIGAIVNLTIKKA